MSTSGLEVIDRSLHITHTWLDEIMETLGPDRQVAWHVLGGVLRSLRDRLPPDLAAHLGAQLPLIIRGTYYDHYQPSKMPEKIRSWDEFQEKLEGELSWTSPLTLARRFAPSAAPSITMWRKTRQRKSGKRCLKKFAGWPSPTEARIQVRAVSRLSGWFPRCRRLSGLLLSFR